MSEYETDFREAVRLEQRGDAAAASGQPAMEFYRAAQTHLLPCGRKWNDPAEYGRHMVAFERLQEKMFRLAEVPEEPWLQLLRERRFPEAARMLASRASGRVGIPYYEKRGRRVEEEGDESARTEDPWAARISYTEAIENYLLGAALSQERADYEAVERAMVKLQALDS